MIILAQVKEMLDMQEQLEIRICGSNWRQQQHDYRLCIHMECAEIIDHYGWKHWKNIDVEPDWNAISMELVDVWHFALAHVLCITREPDHIYKDMCYAEENYNIDHGANVIQLCINIGNSMFKENLFLVGNFYALMDFASMNWDDLYRLYIGKNILNWFRQDHGYKEGLYMKNWAGKEDNVHLFEITEILGDDFNSLTLLESLKIRYELAGH